ncbi:hypothetical protein [Winogradskyella sp. A2]|uniref:hypothetical protein n=1 Tax=Winogradskyella sp. A2 TaxID=3366944 RepID=UPI00398C43ED
MKTGVFYLNIFLLLFLTCGDSSDGVTGSETTEVQQKEIKITQKTIDDFDYTDYVLSTEGEKAVANWEKYQELAIQVSYLKKADLSFFKSEVELLQEFVEEFKSTVPEDLQTNPIVSRIVIVETALFRLNANLTLDNIDSEEKAQSLKAVFVALSNLNFQINKKLERDLYDKISSENFQN